MLVCYIKHGQDIIPNDDDLIDFEAMYYVIIKPVCNEHSNNNSFIINFDDSESESEDEETDDEMNLSKDNTIYKNDLKNNKNYIIFF